jgi:predicted molibdopterin-dependent oxidoreductase YjgC
VLGRAFFALQIGQFQTASSGQATTIVPAAAALEKDGTLVNLEGRVQRLRTAAAPPEGTLDPLVWASELGRRLGVELPHEPAHVFARLAAERPRFAGVDWRLIGEHAPPPDRSRPAAPPPAPQLAGGEPEPPGTTVVAYRQLMSGPAVENSPHLHFQRRIGIEIPYEDARALGVDTGDTVTVTVDGRATSGPAVVQRRLRRGVVRMPANAAFVDAGELAAGEPADA